MSIIKFTPQEVVYDQKEVMPYGKLWNFIDWNKVFQDKIWLFYPKPIDWNKAINEQWLFDSDKFLLSRSWFLEKRESYLDKISKEMARFEKLYQLNRLDLDYLWEWLEHIIQWLQNMYFLWKENSEVYKKDFYTELKNISEQITAEESLPEKSDFNMLLNDIKKSVEKWLARENKEREIHIAKIKKYWDESLKKYVKEDGFLDVESILKAINSHWTWNEEIMLTAFYTAKCNKNDLTKLQTWVIEALNSKIKRLDTFKVFIILDWILPYIYNEFKIDRDLPEIFRPEYLSRIRIYDLDLDWFISQVKYKWKELNRSEEIQNKLIEQFKQFWQSESWKIWFWQWSEQLWYWNWVTSGVNEQNFKYYMKDPNLWFDKMPIPSILDNDRSSDTSGNLFKELNA
jgi:hypothetical protein